MRKLLTDENLSSEDLKQKLSIVLDEQDLLAPVVDDRLTTELTNAVLRCRDIQPAKSKNSKKTRWPSSGLVSPGWD